MEKKLFVAICSKHGFRTYRYMRQKHATIMLRVNRPFMDCVLWPEYRKYEVIPDKLTEEILTDLISKIHLMNDEDEMVIAEERPLATAASAL